MTSKGRHGYACSKRWTTWKLFLHVYQGHDGNVYVHVENRKGGRPREVQALPGHHEDVWAIREGRSDDERVFERIPRHLDVHSVRREFAQTLYQHYANGRDLPHRTDGSNDKTTIALQRNG